MEPSTAYHPQTDSQSEIVNKQITQVARACKAEGQEWLSNIVEIPLTLNSRYNASRRNNFFVTVLDCDDKLGLNTFPCHINKYQPTTLQKKKSPAMPITLCNRYLICFSNINATLVEPNWMIHIPSAYCIYESKIILEEGITNWVTIACVHFCNGMTYCNR